MQKSSKENTLEEKSNINISPGPPQKIKLKIFKDPIKHLQEDEFNKKGEKLSFKSNKGYTTIIWEQLILGLIVIYYLRK